MTTCFEHSSLHPIEVEHLMDVFRALFRANLCWCVHSAATVANPYTPPIRLPETSLGLKGRKCLVSEVVNCLSLVRCLACLFPVGLLTGYVRLKIQDSLSTNLRFVPTETMSLSISFLAH